MLATFGLQSAQALKSYAPELLSTLQQAMATDNEENALLCMRAVFDLYKGVRPDPNEGSSFKSLCDLVHQVSRCAPTAAVWL